MDGLKTSRVAFNRFWKSQAVFFFLLVLFFFFFRFHCSRNYVYYATIADAYAYNNIVGVRKSRNSLSDFFFQSYTYLHLLLLYYTFISAQRLNNVLRIYNILYYMVLTFVLYIYV